jgi:aminoglycoside phosphotransferase (APT) family kinase protein
LRIGVDEARAAGIPVRPVGEARAGLVRSVAATREVLQPSDALWARWQAWLADDAGWPEHTGMVHGDLHPGHMLLDPGGVLVGILDWTEAQHTDPSVDLAMFFGCFGRAALEALVDRMVHHGGAVWPGAIAHAAARWSIFPAIGAEWALRTGNAAVLEHTRGLVAAAA